MKIKRQSKIIELIEKNTINTQEDLTNLLKKEGFDVTQATVSRDIKELRLVKTMTEDGKYKYSTTKTKTGNILHPNKFYNIFSDSVISMDYAGNLVIIKCFSGIANAVCAAIDSMDKQGIVGTIAGDDTIFIALKTEEHALNLLNDLKKLK